MSIPPPNCWKRRCKHHIEIYQPDGKEPGETVVCDAFPKGIPQEIAYGSNLHGEVHPEQVGDFVFEKATEEWPVPSK
jgi:hypothetical protein